MRKILVLGAENAGQGIPGMNIPIMRNGMTRTAIVGTVLKATERRGKTTASGALKTGKEAAVHIGENLTKILTQVPLKRFPLQGI